MSKHRGRANTPRSVGNMQRLALPGALWLLVTNAGCEIVLGGIPRDRVLDDGGDDPTREDAGIDPEVDAGSDAGSDDERDGGLDAATHRPDARVTQDADVPEDDDAGSDAGDDADVSDASEPIDLDAYACTSQTVWYVDSDGDGFGVSAGSFTGCPRPAGSWALEDGDCQDENREVHPGQAKFFGVSYPTSSGIDSFDYDCSGAEEDSGTQNAFESCGLLGLLCDGSNGYAPSGRAGSKVNKFCGSDTIQTCSGALCATQTSKATRPFVCR